MHSKTAIILASLLGLGMGLNLDALPRYETQPLSLNGFRRARTGKHSKGWHPKKPRNITYPSDSR